MSPLTGLMAQAAWAGGPGLLPVLRILSARIHRVCCCIGRLTPVPLDAVPMGSVSQLFRWCHLQMEVLRFHIKPRTTLLQNGTGFVNTTCQSSTLPLCCGTGSRVAAVEPNGVWNGGSERPRGTGVTGSGLGPEAPALRMHRDGCHGASCVPGRLWALNASKPAQCDAV